MDKSCMFETKFFDWMVHVIMTSSTWCNSAKSSGSLQISSGGTLAVTSRGVTKFCCCAKTIKNVAKLMMNKQKDRQVALIMTASFMY